MLINFTNHPFDKWTNKQKEEALEQYEEVKDLSFPEVNPEGDEEYIQQLADRYLKIILEFRKSDKNFAVHIQGEFTLVYCVVSLLKEYGIKCIASTTRRVVSENPDGTRTYRFEFVRFREYV